MRCNFERLVAYLNDELDEQQKHDVLIHLPYCEICMEAVSTMLQDKCIKDEIPYLPGDEAAVLEQHATR